MTIPVARSSKEFETALLKAALPKLTRMGMQKRAHWIFTCALAPEAIGWLSFPSRLDRSEVHIMMSVNVGVRHQTLERTLAELEGEKFHAYHPPSMMTSLDSLMPRRAFPSWVFTNETDNAALLNDVISCIEKYGLAFMRDHTGLDSIVETGYQFQSRESRAYRVPVAYFLMGESEKVRESLNETLESIADRDDFWAQGFRKFAANLSTRMHD